MPLALVPEAGAAARTLDGPAVRLQQPSGAGTDDGAALTPAPPLPDWLGGPLQALVNAVQAQQAGRSRPHAAH